jgi:hypothetical protein
VKLTLTISVVLLLGLVCLSQSPRPLPPQMRHSQELQAQNESTTSSRLVVDTVAMRGEADQLASLAASVPPDVQNANKGLMSKDLIQKLKQIEKLSKHLRSELGH